MQHEEAWVGLRLMEEKQFTDSECNSINTTKAKFCILRHDIVNKSVSSHLLRSVFKIHTYIYIIFFKH